MAENIADRDTTEDKRVHLVQLLKKCSLSYQQHQLLHSLSFSTLVPEVIRQRRWVNLFLALIAVGFTMMTVRGLTTPAAYLPWLTCAVPVWLWVSARVRRSASLISAYELYSSAHGTVEAKSTLGDELKVRFSLSYDEHQAIHSGDARKAASSIIARRKANSTWFFAICVLSSSLVTIAVYCLLDDWLSDLFAFLFTGVLIIAMLVCFARDHYVVREVRKVLAKFNESRI